MSQYRYLSSLLVAALVACLLGSSAPRLAFTQPAAKIATFSVRFENKLYIGTIPLAQCDPVGVYGKAGVIANPGLVAAYMAFCAATSATQATVPPPPTGAIVVPLDARIRGGVDVQWRCQAGNPKPLGPTGTAALATAAGVEGPGINGIVNPTPTRDNIAANGTWGVVVSGHPNPKVEPVFQVLHVRARPDIWQHMTGTVTCGQDAKGNPTSRVNVVLSHTAFPSHRVWYRTPIKAAAAALFFNVAQGAFSNLWALPAIPAP
jgi:hypothetical protein